MTDRELMQMALDALEYSADEIGCPDDDDCIGVARKALRARLAQPERMSDGYFCVVCGRHLEADEYGVIVHDDVPHPVDMAFDEEDKPQ